jgi:hypothetical protein
MMALLAGSRLADSSLRLTKGSDQPLAEFFPAVKHIRRFNLKSDVARTVLLAAEVHLGAMAIPYILALHEDYVMHALEVLHECGKLSKTKLEKSNSSNMHGMIESSTGVHLDPICLELHNLLRLLRNSHIHAGGRARAADLACVASLSNAARTTWEQMTSRPLSGLVLNHQVEFRMGSLRLH